MTDFIPRRYNYTLETGTVGTDNQDIANILYNVNPMEMKASFSSKAKEEMEDTLADALFMVTDCKVHFKRFVQDFSEKLNNDDVVAYNSDLDSSLKIIRAAETSDIDINAIHSAILFAYQKMLAGVPRLIDLDDQSLGKVK